MEEAHSKPQLIRLKQLLTMVPFSASTVWRKVRDGTFVRPRKISARITVWSLAEVELWLVQQGSVR